MRANITSDGWRGLTGCDINPETVLEISLRLPVVPGDRVVIGYDTRRDSAQLAAIVADTLAARGCHCVVSDRPVPTPIVAWQTREQRAALGIQVTASHNPQEYNGIKLRQSDGSPIDPSALRQIEASAPGTRNALAGCIKKLDLWTAYIQSVQTNLAVKARSFPPIVVDSMYGTTAGLLSRIHPDADITVIRNDHDPSFGGCSPEPTRGNLCDLACIVEKTGRLGFAHDGDGDRIAVWAPDVGYVSPHLLSALLAMWACDSGIEGGFVASVTTSSWIERISRTFGRAYYETDVGFHHASKLLRTKNVILACEENGGIGFGGHIPDRDGTYAACRVLTGLAREESWIGLEFQKLQARFGRNTIHRVDLPTRADCIPSITALEAAYNGSVTRTTEILRGAKVWLRDGSWVVARRAGTEPLLRIYACADEEERALGLIHAARRSLDV